MKLNDERYDLTLAWASGELDEAQARGLDSAADRDRIESLAAIWRDVESLVQTDDAFEPSAAAIARAASIPAALHCQSQAVSGGLVAAAKESLEDLLDRFDGFLARLVHDDRLTPMAVRGDVAAAIHMAWEAGELDIDLVAEPTELDPLTGRASRWILRGEVMADIDVGGLEAALVDHRTGIAVETAALDPRGYFVLEAESGSWGLRIGVGHRGLHLEPVELG